MKQLPDIAYLRRNFPQITRLHVLGHGLNATDIPALDSLQLIPHLSASEEGITAIHWTPNVTTGNKLQVQGVFENKQATPVTLTLEGFGTWQDSIQIPGKSKQKFQLSTMLKERGKFLYQLKIYRNSQQVQEEKIPVIVQAPSPLRILILEAFPGFEVKFLKNWLANRKNSVVVRSTISKNKFRTEFINHDKIAINTITPTILENFDILISDEQSFLQVNTQENTVLQRAVKDGLGVLITWREPKKAQNNAFLSRFKLTKPATPEEKPTKITWPDMPAGAPGLPITSTRILYTPGTRSLVMDENKETLVSTQLWGRGKVIVSVANATYTWALDGKQNIYDRYWAYLLNNTSPGKTGRDIWETENTVPIVNQAVQYELSTSSSEQVPVGQVNRVPFYLAQDKLQAEKWKGVFWPDSTGWQAVSTSNGTSYWQYVYSPTDWKTIQFQQRRAATLKFIQTQSTQFSLEGPSVKLYGPRPVSSIWFFLLFLCSMTYLWVERKL